MSLISGKEARKKELKKNKKQRLMVRSAVLRGKDPATIIDEMEKLDLMGIRLILSKFTCNVEIVLASILRI